MPSNCFKDMIVNDTAFFSAFKINEMNPSYAVLLKFFGNI